MCCVSSLLPFPYTVVVLLYAMLFFGDEDAALACRGGENNPVEESYFRGQNDRLGYRAWPAGYNLEKRMTQLGIPRAFWTKPG